jgi:hypothetical protein
VTSTAPSGQDSINARQLTALIVFGAILPHAELVRRQAA